MMHHRIVDHVAWSLLMREMRCHTRQCTRFTANLEGCVGVAEEGKIVHVDGGQTLGLLLLLLVV